MLARSQVFLETALTTTGEMTFDSIELSAIDTMGDHERDALPFGVVGLDHAGIARVYNATESRLAGLDRDTVIGAPFFDAIAQCMNNFMVAQRFEDEPVLDAIVPFVLTLRMRPTRVRLRLLAGDGSALRYVLIER